MKKAKILSLGLASVVAISAIQVPAFAAKENVYSDGTYTKTETVQPDEWEDFTAYDLNVDIVIKDGKISDVALSESNDAVTKRNMTYCEDALEGMKDEIIANNGVEGVDAVSGATCSSNAIISAVSAALEEAAMKEEKPDEGEAEEKPDEGETEEKPDAGETGDNTEILSGAGYVLMNIPYDEFYVAEGVEGVDTVTSATVKTYNQNMAAGTYHEGYEAADPIANAEILGVTYPVYVEDLSVLEGLTQVTDADSATITVASGKRDLTTKEVSGVDLLFASGTYAFYVMDEAPDCYKTLSVSGDNFSFSAVSEETVKAEGMEVELSYGGHYTDIEFVVSAAEITDTAVVNGVTLTTSDGEEYALRHVEDIWRKTDLGWNWDSLDGAGLAGKTIEKVTYYIVDNGNYSSYEYDVNATVKLNPGEITASFDDVDTITVTGLPEDIENAKATVMTKVGRGETATVIAENVDVIDGKIETTEAAEGGDYTITIVSDNYGDVSAVANIVVPGYVLMNIPYDEFYAAEGVEGVDTVTSATVKTYNQNMAGGSYHEGYEAADPIANAEILGVTYPVYVEDMSVLRGMTKVTDADTATITVAAGKSSLTTAEVSGVDLLFASGTYAYYKLAETPTNYKTLTVNEDGSFEFSATKEAAVADEIESAEMVYGGHYTDIELVVSDDKITDTAVVNGVTLTTSDGEEYALRHVENIWRKTDLGWNWEDLDGNGLAGKTITNITYYLYVDGADEDTENDTYAVYSYDVNLAVKLNPGEATAEFTDANTITVTGLPEDIKNATATVKTKVGRGETATVIAENVEVVDGKIVTTTAAEEGTYVITIVSENYGDLSVNAEYKAPVEPENPAKPEDSTDKDADVDNNGNGSVISPQTGDAAGIIGLLGVLVASGGITINTMRKRREE